MAFHDFASMNDYRNPYEKEIHVSFIEVDAMRSSLQAIFEEVCSDKPNLDRLFDHMQYVASKYDLDFNEEYLEQKK